MLTEVRRRRLRGFIARPWVLLWLVGFLVICHDPESIGQVESGHLCGPCPARVTPPGFSLVGRPVKPQGHCCVKTVIAVEAATPRCPAGLRCLPGERVCSHPLPGVILCVVRPPSQLPGA